MSDRSILLTADRVASRTASAQPAPEPLVSRGPWRKRASKAAAAIFIGVVFTYLYSPPAVMAVFSFNDSKVQTLPLRGFTFDWYVQLSGNSELVNALLYSVRVSATAVAVSVIVGTLFALILWKPFRGSAILQGLLALPMLLPGMVLGVSLLLSFKLIGLSPSFLTLVVAHVVFTIPIVVFVVGQRLAAFDPALLHASQDLGASPIKSFVTVLLPLLSSAIVAAALLSFTLSFDELAVSFFVAGFDRTLPVFVWSALRIGFDPQINAVFTILAVLSVLAVVVSFRILRGRGGRGSSDR